MFDVLHETMKRDPTRLVLYLFSAFYGLVAAGRWYFFVRPPCSAPGLHLSWVGIAGNVIGFAICTFLLFDALNPLARVFWLVETVSSVLSLAFRCGLFQSFPRHADPVAAVHFTVLFFLSLGFLTAHMVSPFSLFGPRAAGLLRKCFAEQHKAPPEGTPNAPPS